MIHVFSTAEEVAVAVAEAFIPYTEKCISETGNCIVAISGGTTPNALFSLLNTDAYRDRVDWEHLYFIWVDERFIPQNDPDNNYFRAKERLFCGMRGLCHIYPVPTNNGTVEEAAALYEKEVNTVLIACRKDVPDLVLLGLGDDGHTASLFPKSEALRIFDRRVAYVKDGKVWDRVTLTFPFLISGKAIWFTVVGDAKRAALSRVLRQIDSYGDEPWEKRIDRTLPAAVFPKEKVTWYVDEKAKP